MKGQTYIISALIFALLIAIFAVINVDPVQVNYLFGSGEAPLILVIIISVLMGGLVTASVGAVRYFKLKRQNRSLRNQLANLEETAPKEEKAETATTQEEDDHKEKHRRNAT
ncbi:lipopolysaccharide assembly protein LapA domain-containing protein [Halobacillus salinarum]|uniref:Lipopolysaccharide assembly protein LapA domain-containing protein n=1 Tax=Halobacillus salinarum TaxID=2932257 RepID=A0ABY4EQX1_9BACI|nr:lipopolysaccharide assembly protein LapA domain-containing protein [Halobacillus salinarum]UOQ46278.1 lipopolysaccharide assembly protein LapA domain-containing protein [Halobacillus salinarum]